MCIVINFFVLSSICLSFSFVHFKNGPKYLRREATQVIFAAEFGFEKFSRLSEVFFSYFFSFISACLISKFL